MKDEKQIVLFFSKGTVVDSTQLAAKLNAKFPMLGDALVIPFDQNNPTQPLILFNRGEIQLTVGIRDISFIYKSEKHKEFFKEIIDMIGFFEELEYSFERFGYISTFLHTREDRKKFIKNTFKDEDMIKSDFNLSWYSKELVNSVSVNVWEKEISDLMNNVELVSIYDINSPIDEVYNITSEFMEEFIKHCDKYLENRDKK